MYKLINEPFYRKDEDTHNLLLQKKLIQIMRFTYSWCSYLEGM